MTHPSLSSLLSGDRSTPLCRPLPPSPGSGTHLGTGSKIVGVTSRPSDLRHSCLPAPYKEGDRFRSGVGRRGRVVVCWNTDLR